MNNSEKPVDISKIDLEKEKEKTAANPSLLPYAHTVGGVVIKPEDEGKIKGLAVKAMQEQTEMQMGQIYEQMQLLAKQAQNIQLRVEISQKIYEAELRFDPIIGHTYYFYVQPDASHTLSLVAPHEWGRTVTRRKYLAKVRLLADHTWEILETADSF